MVNEILLFSFTMYVIIKQLNEFFKIIDFCSLYDNTFENYYNSESYFQHNLDYQLDQCYDSDAEVQW